MSIDRTLTMVYYDRIIDIFRVAPDTDLAGYPANIFAGYPAK